MRRHSCALVLATVSLLLLGACGGCDDDVRDLTFILEPDPASLEFGEAPIRFPTPLTVTLTSLGTGAVGLESVTIEGAGAAAWVVPPMPEDAILGPGERTSLIVEFAPEVEGDYLADLVVVSNAAGSPLRIPLDGVGKAPDIELCLPLEAGQTDPVCVPAGDPLVLDYGRVIKNRTVTRAALIRNVGEAPLKVFSEGTGLSTGTAEAGWSPAASLAGATIVAGGGIEVPITFLGKEQGAVSGRLTIASNDPDEPEAFIDLVAEGAANGPPVACAEVFEIEHQDQSVEVPANPTAPLARPADRLFFTAHPRPDCSLDPEDGQVLSYDWRLVTRPDNSGANIANSGSGPAPGTAEQPPWMEIDAIGTYVVELVVRDGLSLASSPVQVTIDAIPKDDITVELSWHVRADVDLHLVAPGGVPFCDPLDCFWDTCWESGGATGIPFLDWGPDTDADGKLDADSDTSTDPILVFDNVGSTVVGADTRLENIRLPVASLGAPNPYQVAVHYFEDKGVVPQTFDVNVKVVFQGAVLLDETHTFPTANVGDVWLAGEVDVASGVGTALAFPDTNVSNYIQPIACP